MQIKNQTMNWITKHYNNPFVVGLITFSFPGLFLKALLENNRNKNYLWKKKKACLTISFDCDYPQDVEAIPAILKILSKYLIRTSFACVGYWIEKYPAVHKMILDAGHEILNHTYSHPDNEILNPGRKFKEISRNEKKEEIEKCHEICYKVLKYEPVGCRIPHFKNLFTDDIYGILKEIGYVYSSSTLIVNTRTFGMPFKTLENIFEFPLSSCLKHPFTVFDTWHSFNSSRLFYKMIHKTEDEYINLFKRLINIGIDTNSYINIYIDPYDIMKMKRFVDLLNFLEEKKEDLLISTYQDILNEIKLKGIK